MEIHLSKAEGEWARSARIGRRRQLTSPNTKKNRTTVWTHVTMTKYLVASATIVFNKTDNWRPAALEYANQRIRKNVEKSDAINSVRLAMVVSGGTH